VRIELDPVTRRFRAVSGEAVDLLGFAVKDWLRPDFWALRLHPEDRERVCAHCLNEAKAGRGHEIDYRMTDRLGNSVWVHQACDMITMDVDSGTWVLSGHIIDISDRVAQQVELSHALALRDTLLEVINTEFSQPVNIVSGYARLLERHLATLADDVGSDYALGMREGIEVLTEAVNRLRAASQHEASTIESMIAELLADTRETPLPSDVSPRSRVTEAASPAPGMD
jgi:signal transduction histidine kinase